MLERWCNWVVLLWGWRRWGVAFVAGGISALAMAPFHAFPVLWLTFPVLVWLLDGSQDRTVKGTMRRFRPALAVGWWFGFGYFLAGLWWIGLAFLVEADQFGWMMPIAVVALPAGLALFWAVAAGISAMFWREGWRRIIILAIAMTLMEWVRGTVLTGFPWNTVGYALAPNVVFMQAGSLFGLYGLTAVALLVFSAPAVLGGDREEQRRGNRVFLAVAAAIFLAVPAYGFIRLAPLPEQLPQHEDVRLRIMQPAIAQSEKWKPENAAAIIERYLELSNSATSPEHPGIVGVTHLIWPESAFPFILTRHPKILAAIADLLPTGTTLITGAIRELAPSGPSDTRKIYNAIYVIDHTGEIADAYDKVDLVPFGEFLPFADLLERFGLRQLAGDKSGFEAGQARRALRASPAPAFTPLICYEAIFPARSVSETKSGTEPAEWLLNLTNDAWFGDTPGPAQHFHQARLRSVERGQPLVRAANTGISAIVDPYGRIQAMRKLGARGVFDGTLPRSLPMTWYAQFGDLWVLLILSLIFGLVVLRVR